MQTRIDINDRQVEIELEVLQERAGRSHALQAMQAVARYMLTSTRLRFRRQIGPDGVRWIPSKAALDRGGQTLRASGRLQRSLTWQATPGSAEVGTNVAYARVHQLGIAEIVRVRAHRRMTRIDYGDGAATVKSVQVRAHSRAMLMHRRPYLGFSLYDRSEIVMILREYISSVRR